MHRKWQRPKLIVLVKDKPEYSVLDYCKSSDSGGINSNQDSCIDAGGSYWIGCSGTCAETNPS